MVNLWLIMVNNWKNNIFVWWFGIYFFPAEAMVCHAWAKAPILSLPVLPCCQFQGSKKVGIVVPSGKLSHNYGKSPCLMGKLTIAMVIFNSYVKLPEGKYYEYILETQKNTGKHYELVNTMEKPSCSKKHVCIRGKYILETSGNNGDVLKHYLLNEESMRSHVKCCIYIYIYIKHKSIFHWSKKTWINLEMLISVVFLIKVKFLSLLFNYD